MTYLYIKPAQLAMAALLGMPLVASAQTAITDPVHNDSLASERIREAGEQPDREQKEQRLLKDEKRDLQGPSFQSLFGIPLRKEDYKPSQQIRCDALRHLKTPSTYRRLDSYFRPEVILPRAKNSDFFKRDFMTGDWGKTPVKSLQVWRRHLRLPWI